jgi:hypothetical protein
MRTLGEILQGEEDFGSFLIKCRMDFKFFVERVMGMELMPYHLYWIECFMTKRRTCITAPRGSGKTYQCGVLFPIWVSLFKSDQRFLIVAAGKDKAKDIIKELRAAIENNELLNALLTPEGKSTSWSTQEMKTKTNCQFIVRAYTGKGIRGQHVDYALMDEGGEIDNKDTALFFDGIVPTVSHKNGHIMVIGTPKTETDLLSILSEPMRGYHSITYSMWDDNTQTSMWPSKFPKEKLELIKKEMGLITFRREYLCERVDEGVMPFKLADIVRSYEKAETFHNMGRMYKTETDEEQWGNYFIGVDLAMSPQGDFSVYTVVELLNGKVYIRKMIRIRGVQYKDQEKMVRQLYEDFKPMRVIVDKSVFGEVFVSDLRDMGVPAEPFKFTPDNRNKILDNLMRLFEGDKVAIPRNKEDSDCITETATLTDELQKIIFDTTNTGMRTYRSIGKHDDTVMSFALAVIGATEFGPSCEYMEAEVDSRDQMYLPQQQAAFVGDPLSLTRPPIGW